jgi:sugar O-acyltransferase (sialic acid O-acetyltransferase NeuD family)
MPTPRPSYVFGSGGHARVIASLLTVAPRYIVPEPSADGQIAESSFFAQMDQLDNSDIYIGIGDNTIRKRVFAKIKANGLRVANCIASTAFVAADAKLGEGVVVCAGSVVGSCAVLGDNTIVNSLSSVDHDCVLGAHTQITAGVTLGGTVLVGDLCFFGVKCAVTPNTTIGDNVVVMAGSLVTKDVPSNVMVGGSPARVMRTLA